MCGIAGLMTIGLLDDRLLRQMIGSISHRGPDDEGVWIDADAGIGLGHRRLAILDRSPAGHQPMASANGRYLITYNAEIYNHFDLRKDLEAEGSAPPGGWRGHSDTETFLECISAWGLDATLPKIVGMFAFALWDKEQGQLHLVRDRFGEKPLYYGWVGNDFVFASELKAIRVHPMFLGEIDRRALRLFASRTYVPAPFSIYKRLFKLEPGCVLTITQGGALTPLDAPPKVDQLTPGITIRRYWSYRDVVRRGLADPFDHERDALEQLDQVLARAIQDQSVADVPVGAFLSGGIDSSTVVALYQKYSSLPVRTFTIGFEEAGFNEAEDAKAVAAHLGTIHNACYVTVKEAREVIPMLPTMYDEPFADSSQIPTYLVSRFASEQVKVALTGDGADELFAGYNRHFTAPPVWQQLRKLPKPLRSVIGSPISRLPLRFWHNAAKVLPGRRPRHLGAKIQKGLRVAGAVRNFDELYSSFLDEWSFENSPVRGGDAGCPTWDLECADGAPDTVRMMYCDAVSYLPDDILCKVDRASMAVSLETRVPYLDHRVAELAARIPLEMKVRGGTGKHILRQLLYREVPRNLIERPKAGFGIPVGEWIRTSLRPWAEELLEPRTMAADGWFDPAIVQRRWHDHLSGRRDSTAALWAMLMFQAWLREQKVSVREVA